MSPLEFASSVLVKLAEDEKIGALLRSLPKPEEIPVSGYAQFEDTWLRLMSSSEIYGLMLMISNHLSDNIGVIVQDIADSLEASC